MEIVDMILADDFCAHHSIELSFVYSLRDSGLIEIKVVEDKVYVHISQLSQLEKLVRLYYGMDINLEGLETITHLLQQLTDMQHRVTRLTNRLRIYENE